jgi:hypothetical protein
MALAGLLSAISPVLGGLGGGGSTPETSSAQATTTNTTTLTSGAMTQISGVSLLIVGILLYFVFKG